MKKEELPIPSKSIIFYNAWIKHFPESESQTTWELFYLFINSLPKNSKKINRYWLENLLKNDDISLEKSKIEEYCDVYQHTIDCKNVHKTNTAKLFIKELIDKE